MFFFFKLLRASELGSILTSLNTQYTHAHMHSFSHNHSHIHIHILWYESTRFFLFSIFRHLINAIFWHISYICLSTPFIFFLPFGWLMMWLLLLFRLPLKKSNTLMMLRSLTLYNDNHMVCLFILKFVLR